MTPERYDIEVDLAAKTGNMATVALMVLFYYHVYSTIVLTCCARLHAQEQWHWLWIRDLSLRIAFVMKWIIIPALFIIALVLFVLLTDGRYGGKRLMYWVYDTVGPVIFSARSEEARWRRLLETIGLRGDERILDVGTATGDLPLSLAGMVGFGGQIVGIDWAPRMIAEARVEAERRGLDHLLHFDVVDVRQGVPFANGSFDVIFCLGLLETISESEALLPALTRLLSQNGVLAVSLYRGGAARHVALDHAWYRRQLEPLGVTIREVVPFRKHHDVLIAQARQGEAL
jgi:ubiquinone/menaquinone biosynthesis C-methylase UbiE